MRSGDASELIMMCEGYPGLAYVFHRLLRENMNEKATIVVPVLEDLYLFFQAVTERVFDGRIKTVYIPRYERRRRGSVTGFLVVLRDAIAERRHLKRVYKQHFKGLRGAEVTFSSPGYNGEKVYLLKEFSGNNRLTYVDPGPPYIGPLRPRTMRERLTLVLNKVRYGSHVRLGEFPRGDSWDEGFPTASDAFMAQVDHVIDWSNRDGIMESFDWSRFGNLAPGDYEVMYFHQDLPRSAGVVIENESSFRDELRKIFEVVLRYFPEDRIARKYHPAHQHKNLIGVGTELPTIIPAELLYRDSVRLYLGFDSTALSHVRGSAKVVSLIDLISFGPDSVRERLKRRLVTTSYCDILIPSSLAELEETIRTVSGRTEIPN